MEATKRFKTKMGHDHKRIVFACVIFIIRPLRVHTPEVPNGPLHVQVLTAFVDPKKPQTLSQGLLLAAKSAIAFGKATNLLSSPTAKTNSGLGCPWSHDGAVGLAYYHIVARSNLL